MDAAPQAPAKVVTDVADLNRHIGVQLGPSREIVIDQAMLDGFGSVEGLAINI